MAHELATRANGSAAMAFIGETPWHKLGQSVTKGAPLETWAREAGLEWRALESVVHFQTGETASGEYRADGSPIMVPVYGMVDDKKVLYRSDTGAALSVMGDGYKTVQPLEVLEFFRDLTEAGDWHIHTAGALRGGRKIWAMASNHTEGEVSPGDTVKGNLLLATSLDGSMKTTAAITATRVVCANTLRLALSDATGKIEVSHRSEFDPSEVKRALGVARESFATFMDQARVMAETPVGIEEARDILRTLFGQPVKLADVGPARYSKGTADGSEFAQLLARPAAALAEQKIREHRNVTRTLALFGGEARGSHHAGSHGTRWGLFNACTEFLDHEAGRSADTRLDSAWFGRGHDIKQTAFEMLLAK